HAVIQSHLGRSLSRSDLARVADVSGGNPLYAIELARVLDHQPQGPLQLPPTLRLAVSERLARLDPRARELLETAAVIAAPSLPMLQTVFGDFDLNPLLRAESDGIISIESNGSIRFSHPLFA